VKARIPIACVLLGLVALTAMRGDAQSRGDALAWPAEDSAQDEPEASATCWSGLPGIAMDFDSLPGAMRVALASGDERLRDLLLDRLVELVGDDVARAGRVLDWIRGARDHDEIAMYAEALSRTDAVHSASIRERIVSMAEDRADVEHQGAALAMLETQRSFDGRTLDRLVEVGKSTSDDANAEYAIKTIGAVMERGCEGADCERYMRGALDVASSSTDGAQRLAVEMLSTAPARMPERIVLRTSEIMRESPTPWTRQLAALAIATAAPPERALAALRDAFYAESHFCTRVSIFRDAAAAAGPRALPLMADFARAQPELQEAYVLFEQVYRSGVVAYDRVVSALFDRVFPGCSAAQEADGLASEEASQ